MSSTARWRRPFLLARRALTAPLTLRKVGNILLGLASYGLSLLTRRPIIWGRPFLMMMEPSSLCNLRCPLCAVGAGQLSRPQGHMPLEGYRKVLEEMAPYLMHLTLWNQGEPFLHPQLLEMIRLAKAKGMVVLTSTNGHFLDDRRAAEALVQAGLDDLIISLDGVDPQTYREYRRGGDFHQVLRGIRQLVAAKKRLQSAGPYIELQFLIMRHNQHQIDAFRRLAKGLQVDRISLKTLQVETLRQARQYLPGRLAHRRYVLSGASLSLKGRRRNNCRWLWLCPVINSDGTVCPCCFDKDNHLAMGNVFDSRSLTDIWRGDRYRSFRHHILTNRAQLHLCQNCSEGLTRLVIRKESV